MGDDERSARLQADAWLGDDEKNAKGIARAK